MDTTGTRQACHALRCTRLRTLLLQMWEGGGSPGVGSRLGKGRRLRGFWGGKLAGGRECQGALSARAGCRGAAAVGPRPSCGLQGRTRVPDPPCTLQSCFGQGVATEAFAHEAGYDAYMTGAAFACLVRLYEAAQASAAGAGAPGAEQQPSLAAVEELRWRINLSRWVLCCAVLCCAVLCCAVLGHVCVRRLRGVCCRHSSPHPLDATRAPHRSLSNLAFLPLPAGRRFGSCESGPPPHRPPLTLVPALPTVHRSDMSYAALQGDDPQPDRSHVFYLGGWPEGKRVFGGDIVK